MRKLTTFLPLAALALAASAQGQTITFQDVDPGSVINTTYASSFGVTFNPPAVNTTAGQVYADNPGLPANPTRANNALVGIYDPIYVSFAPAFYPGGGKLTFNVIPDPQGFGSASASVLAFDAANNLLGSFPIDETTAGTYTVGAPGAVSLELPADTYYGNLKPTSAVPEPGSIALGLALLGSVSLLLRRRQ